MPDGFPNTVLAALLDKEKLSAGVLVEVATDVVKSGDRFPELKLVTVPAPAVVIATAD